MEPPPHNATKAHIEILVSQQTNPLSYKANQCPNQVSPKPTPFRTHNPLEALPRPPPPSTSESSPPSF